MDFLSKIKKHLNRGGDKEFRKQVLSEKKQKYLFSDDITDKYRSSRAWFIYRKKRAIAPFTNSFGEGFTHIKKRAVETHALAYMWITLLLLSAYIVFYSPYFRVSPSHVLLEASNDGIDISVAYRSIEDIYGQSIFLLDETTVALTLKKSLKNLAHVTIDKLYPNGVKILMTSTPIVYQARIYGFDREWRMSDNGVLIPRISRAGTWSTTLRPIEIVSEALKGEVFFDYKQVIPDDRMLLINRIIELFESEWWDIVPTKIRYFARENELHLTLKSNTTILLTLESESNSHDYSTRIESIKNQLLWLKTYIDTYKASLTDESTVYIDARIVKKIFTCKQKETCKNNLMRIYGNTYDVTSEAPPQAQ